MFLGLPDPDSLVKDTDPDPSIIEKNSFYSCFSRSKKSCTGMLSIGNAQLRYGVIYEK